jgi:protein transport protein SEC24
MYDTVRDFKYFPSQIYDVFGVHNASQIDVERTHLEERDNPTSRRVREVVGLLLAGLGLGHIGHRVPGQFYYRCALSKHAVRLTNGVVISDLLGRSRRPRLVLIRQREKLDVVFRHHLCEDRTGAGAGDASFSYVDFLCHMHKEIRALLG